MGQSKAITRRTEADIDWYNAEEWGVTGKGWSDTPGFYHRLPTKAETMVPESVWRLSHDSAGMYVEFATDATTIHARWLLLSPTLAMSHMPATGVSGVDLYVTADDGNRHWLGVGMPQSYPHSSAQLVTDLVPVHREYRLYLPLYNGVQSVEIGVPSGATFEAIPPRDEKPIVYYGTSITQGAVASRPGMNFTGILGRRLDIPIINLGFSGSAKMEPALAQLLTELDPALYVLDTFYNMDPTLVNQRFKDFVLTLKDARPDTPIVVVGSRTFENTPFVRLFQSHEAYGEQMRESINTALEQLKDAGVSDLLFVPGDNLFSGEGFGVANGGSWDINDGAVDGLHPSDVGFIHYSDILEPILRRVINRS